MFALQLSYDGHDVLAFHLSSLQQENNTFFFLEMLFLISYLEEIEVEPGPREPEPVLNKTSNIVMVALVESCGLYLAICRSYKLDQKLRSAYNFGLSKSERLDAYSKSLTSSLAGM